MYAYVRIPIRVASSTTTTTATIIITTQRLAPCEASSNHLASHLASHLAGGVGHVKIAPLPHRVAVCKISGRHSHGLRGHEAKCLRGASTS